jgi:protein-tyrosine phosphatase
MSPDLFWIPGPWLGKLAVSTRPRGGDWLDDEVSGLRNAGVHVLVSLLERDEAAQLELEGEGTIAESQGVRFVSFPIPDRGVPASTLEAMSLFSALTLALGQGKNVAVHCRQGLGRSGLITAGVLVMSGIGVEQAIESVSCARGQAIPETLDQRNWIQQLSERPVLAS